MKTFGIAAIGIFLLAAFTGTAWAQAQIPSKVALVDTAVFYGEKDGIKKIAAAYKTIDDSFNPDFAALEKLRKDFDALQAQIDALQKSTTPVDPETIRTKVGELEQLQREHKFKQEDTKARYAKRESAVLGPIVEDIVKSIGDFARQNGFTLVLDSGKLFEAGMLVYINDTTDITKDFVQFYNNRPAGSATAKPE